ncbi:MAG: VTT domain-containing protein [Candidatus Heimdallarchaeota archaeon]|nr:MAG: VTT domain-containing protein [Candidatus Heimdallarchaeota archaeon]
MVIKHNNKDSVLLGKIFISIFIVLTIGVIFAVLYFGINIGMELYQFVYRFYDEFGILGINIGVFIISIFGNFTIIFPVPYLFALILISLLPDIHNNPLMLLLLGFSAGLGASIGELTAWILGRAGEKTLKESSKLEKMNQWVEKGYAPFLIFLFAATPLPDDAFMVVLGLANYTLWKVLLFCFIGKVTLTCTTAFIASTASETTLGQFFFKLYGIDLKMIETGVIQPTSFIEIVLSTVTWILTTLLIAGFILIDWNETYNKITKFLKREHV